MLELSIRIDDIFNRGHPARPRSLGPVLDLVESYGFRLILNVIPRRLIESPNQDGAMVRELHAAIGRGHEIIQHGYDHTCRQCGATSHQTYCSKLNRQQPVDEMLSDIQRGKEMLEAAIGQRVYVYGPTGSDPHTTALLNVVKQLGYLAITGETTDDNARLNLPALGGGSDYAFGCTSKSEFDRALQDLISEFDQTLSIEKRLGQARFHILLHDPGIRSGYENGATLDYLRRGLDYITRRSDVRIENRLSRDVLGLDKDQLRLPA